MGGLGHVFGPGRFSPGIVKMGRPVGDVGLPPRGSDPFDQCNVRFAPRPLKLLAQRRYITHRFAGACHAVPDHVRYRLLNSRWLPARFPGNYQGQTQERGGHHNDDGPMTRIAHVVGGLRRAGTAAARLESAMA